MNSSAARPLGFPKEVRLRRRSEFLSVQDRGQKFPAECLLAIALPNPSPDAPARAGFTVSSKVGNAVVRNRIRRRLRELYRQAKASFPKGVDVVFIARTSAADADLPRLRRSFDRVAQDLRRRRLS